MLTNVEAQPGRAGIGVGGMGGSWETSIGRFQMTMGGPGLTGVVDRGLPLVGVLNSSWLSVESLVFSMRCIRVEVNGGCPLGDEG